jgi:hypothetical protein
MPMVQRGAQGRSLGQEENTGLRAAQHVCWLPGIQAGCAVKELEQAARGLRLSFGPQALVDTQLSHSPPFGNALLGTLQGVLTVQGFGKLAV